MKKKTFWWVLVVLWCIMIFYQSSKPAVISSGESGFITKAVNEFFANVFGADKIVLEDGITRKTAHFLEYMVLAALLFNALKNKNLFRTLILSIVIVLCYSISDEIHQHFIPGRAMRIFDVCVDLSGIVTGAGILYLRNGKKGQA
jgi:VanZ family protein